LPSFCLCLKILNTHQLMPTHYWGCSCFCSTWTVFCIVQMHVSWKDTRRGEPSTSWKEFHVVLSTLSLGKWLLRQLPPATLK
jgi:hypothetical protein